MENGNETHRNENQQGEKKLRCSTILKECTETWIVKVNKK